MDSVTVLARYISKFILFCRKKVYSIQTKQIIPRRTIQAPSSRLQTVLRSRHATPLGDPTNLSNVGWPTLRDIQRRFQLHLDVQILYRFRNAYRLKHWIVGQPVTPIMRRNIVYIRYGTIQSYIVNDKEMQHTSGQIITDCFST